MQRRTFTVYQTEAPILTALAMKKPKTSQESSSVQLMYLVCIFSRELVSFSWQESLPTIVIPTANQRIFAPTKEIWDVGSYTSVHCYYICLLFSVCLCLWDNPDWFVVGVSGGVLWNTQWTEMFQRLCVQMDLHLCSSWSWNSLKCF